MRPALVLAMVGLMACGDNHVGRAPSSIAVEAFVEPQLFSKAAIDTIRLIVRATNRSGDSVVVPVRLRRDCPGGPGPVRLVGPAKAANMYGMDFGFVIRAPGAPVEFRGFYQCDATFAGGETKADTFRIAVTNLPIGRFPIVGSFVYQEAPPVWIEVRP